MKANCTIRSRYHANLIRYIYLCLRGFFFLRWKKSWMVPNCIWSILFFIVPFSLPMSKLFCKLKIFYKFKAHQYNWRQAGLMRAEGEFIMQMTWGWFFPVEGRNVSRKQHYPQGCVHQRYRKLRWTERAVSKVSPSAPALMWLELYHRCCQESGADQEFYCLGILWGGGQDLGPEWLHLPPPQKPPPLDILLCRSSLSSLHSTGS